MPTFKDLPSKAEKNYTYAGIGSRRIENVLDPDTCFLLTDIIPKISSFLESLGYTLNSGGAKGCDTLFESGVKDKSHKEIFYAKDSNDVVRGIAKEIHPCPNALSGYVLDLMARNTFQIFGRNLDKPVDFVICYTPDGCETYEDRTYDTGGTGQAIEMASRKGIPVINISNSGWRKKLVNILNKEK